jgi:hypothetical protein
LGWSVSPYSFEVETAGRRETVTRRTDADAGVRADGYSEVSERSEPTRKTPSGVRRIDCTEPTEGITDQLKYD